MSVYRRLVPFVRPHGWRMAGAIAGNIGAALLDAFSLALLIPFLNTLFDQPPISLKAGGLVGSAARDGWCAARSHGQDGLAAQRHLHRYRRGRGEESAGVGRGPVRRDAPGVRHARHPERAVRPPGAPASFVFHAHEDGPDPLARHHGHRRDAPHSDADRDAVAPERSAGAELHRVSSSSSRGR